MYIAAGLEQGVRGEELRGLSPGDPYTPVFVAMAQTFLPNPDRPPFYCDFIVELP